MECSNCGHEQAGGKFCGKCGGAFLPKSPKREETVLGEPNLEKDPGTLHQQSFVDPSGAIVADAPGAKGQPLEAAKEASKNYLNYFMTFLRKPSAIFENTASNLLNASISIAIFFIISILIVHNTVGYLAQLLGSFSLENLFYGSEPSQVLAPTLADVAPNAFIVLFILFALSFGAVCASMLVMNSKPDYKKLITIIGTFLIPAILILAISYILLLVDVRGIGNGLFLLGLVISFFVMPLNAIFGLIKKGTEKYDSLYASVVYTVLFLIGSYAFLSWFLKSKLDALMASIAEITQYLF